MTRLQAGMMAPPLRLIGHNGKKSSLSLVGQKTWLAFYRYGACPLCRDHLLEVLQRQKELIDADVAFIAVFESSKVDLSKKPYAQLKPSFPIVTDTELRLYRRYGVESSPWKLFHPGTILASLKSLANFLPGKVDSGHYRLPAHFLIDASGIINTVHYGVHFGHHIPWSRVTNFLGTKKVVTQPPTIDLVKFVVEPVVQPVDRVCMNIDFKNDPTGDPTNNSKDNPKDDPKDNPKDQK